MRADGWCCERVLGGRVCVCSDPHLSHRYIFTQIMPKQARMFRKIKRGEFKFHSPMWDNVSAEAKARRSAPRLWMGLLGGD